jgi:hypothetical protein
MQYGAPVWLGGSFYPRIQKLQEKWLKKKI